MNRFNANTLNTRKSIFIQAVEQCAEYTKHEDRLEEIGVWFENKLQSPDIKQAILKAAEQGELSYTLDTNDLDPRAKKYLYTNQRGGLKYLQEHIPSTIGAFIVSLNDVLHVQHDEQSVHTFRKQQRKQITQMNIILSWK